MLSHENLESGFVSGRCVQNQWDSPTPGTFHRMILVAVCSEIHRDVFQMSFEHLCATVTLNVIDMFKNKKALAPEWRRATESSWSLYFLTNEVERRTDRKKERKKERKKRNSFSLHFFVSTSEGFFWLISPRWRHLADLLFSTSPNGLLNSQDCISNSSLVCLTLVIAFCVCQVSAPRAYALRSLVTLRPGQCRNATPWETSFASSVRRSAAHFKENSYLK